MFFCKVRKIAKNTFGGCFCIDGPLDGLNSRFEKGKKWESGKPMLENQLKIFNDCALKDNPYVILEQDILEAAPIFSIIGEDGD